MTKPHRYIQNQFVKLSRGTLNGLPLLLFGEDGKLSDEIREIFIRDTGRFNIRLLALNVEPYGYEAIIFDPDMRRSEFLKSVNQCISMKVKKNIDHCESVWSNKKPGNTPILDLVTLENEIFEVCITPVKRGYVREVCDWILPRFGPSDWPEVGGDSSDKGDVSRDEGERSSDNMAEMGAVETLDLESFRLSETPFLRGPSLFSEGGELEGKGKLKTDLLDRIASFQRDEKERRKNVLGQKSCRNRGSFMIDIARNRAEYRAPHRAILCGSKELLAKAVSCLKAYYVSYIKALRHFKNIKESVFPGGILKMRTSFGVSFSQVPDDDVFHFVK